MRRDHRTLVSSLLGAIVFAACAAQAGAAPPPSAPGAAKAAAATAKDTGQGAPAKTSPSKAASGSSASAGSACSSSAAFAQFGDDSMYSLLSNGTLETGRPARRAGRPTTVAGNETFFLHAAGDTHSLQLRAGDSVAFHATCLPRLNPVFRLVARSADGSGTLKLQVQYGPTKRLHGLPLATLSSSDYAAWTATPALPFLNGSQRLLAQVKGNVWLVLTAAGSATWQVDDLYIDPYVNK